MDEADRLLDMGFKVPFFLPFFLSSFLPASSSSQVSLSKILQMLPKQRRTGLFSATQVSFLSLSLSINLLSPPSQTQQLEDIIRTGMRNAVRVRISVQAKNKPNNTNNAQKGAFPVHSLPASLKNKYLVCPESQKLSQLLSLFERYKTHKFIG